MKTIYVVYGCENIPYSDIPDWPIKAYIRLADAEAAVIEFARLEREAEEIEEDEEPYSYFRITELELEE